MKGSESVQNNYGFGSRTPKIGRSYGSGSRTLVEIETETTGNLWSTNEGCPSLVGSLGSSCRYKRFLSFLGCSVSQVPVLWIRDILVRIRYNLKGLASTCEASPDLLRPYSEPPAQQPEPKTVQTNHCKNVMLKILFHLYCILTWLFSEWKSQSHGIPVLGNKTGR
jgi:hypothetical protein